MTITHCPNCGAAITEENSGEYCLYCGGKLPKEETEQTIINNNTNIVNNEFRTTNIIVQTPIIKDTIPKPKKKVIKKYGVDFAAIILGLFIFISGFIGKEPYVSIIGTPFLVFGVFHAPKRNYCNKCGATKKLDDLKCPYCGAKQRNSLSSIGVGAAVLAALVGICILVRLFIK